MLPWTTIYYIGLDVHKKSIAYCIKTVDGETMGKGGIDTARNELRLWLAELPGLWMGAMEATLFTGWSYDFPKPHAVEMKVAHPEMLKAITAAKKKNDRADAEKLADLLRVNLLPECTMMSEELRELRRILRSRNLVVRTAVTMKNKISGLIMEVGDPGRFGNSRQAISYCGLCSAQRESAGKEQRGPISKKRNKHLQTMLIEPATLAPRWNPQLAALHDKELRQGNRNRATLAVEFLLAVDRRGTPFTAEAPRRVA